MPIVNTFDAFQAVIGEKWMVNGEPDGNVESGISNVDLIPILKFITKLKSLIYQILQFLMCLS